VVSHQVCLGVFQLYADREALVLIEGTITRLPSFVLLMN
jgi:hypothetical protein